MTPCKKTLLFHFFIKEDYRNNIMYRFHYECLRRYAHIFDEAIFYITSNDMDDRETISEVKHRLIDCGFKDIVFKERPNTWLCESATFKEEIIDNGWDKDGMVFFMHTKGVWDMTKGGNYFENISHWAAAMYYYSLESVDEAEAQIVGLANGTHPVMYGSLLTIINPDEGDKAFYCGTAYWLNCKQIKNKIEREGLKIPEVAYRAFCEELPEIFNREDSQITSLYNRAVYGSTVDYYGADWDAVSNFFGSGEGYRTFYNDMLTYSHE